MFKVSKRLYWSSRHDEIICRWRHNPPGGETKQPWVKIKFRATLIVILRYLEAKFDYGYFIIYFA